MSDLEQQLVDSIHQVNLRKGKAMLNGKESGADAGTPIPGLVSYQEKNSRPEAAPDGRNAILKVCRRCKVAKPSTELKRDVRNGDGYSSFCKECHREASVNWQRNNLDRVNATRRKRYARIRVRLNEERKAKYDPQEIRWKNLLRLYKVSRAAYEHMLDKQAHKCAVCKADASSLAKPLSVDHNHQCCLSTPTCGNCTRGLLCSACNFAIAQFENDRQWLASALSYLESAHPETGGYIS